MNSSIPLMLLGMALVSGGLFGVIFMTLYQKNRKAGLAMLATALLAALFQLYLLFTLSPWLTAAVFVIYAVIGAIVAMTLKKKRQVSPGRPHK
ncbi:hypothetical protein SAMN04488126_12426 [Bhargavaea beijingensis]|uniref:Uncharacterized protein n=1 Tax=Bhargavaea beijingensis TaxID=426756 RepID=A0A1G7G7B1_9BACL|nr:hypothetical protein [Bhargavaea beijingensis]SDE83987.1 hypothetical protein SAMN04488126_12426 [Bhargavaea beijingensis]